MRIARPRRVLSWILGWSLAWLGCGGGDDIHPCSQRLTVCDIHVESCQRAVYRATACLRHEAPEEMPPVEIFTVEELRDYFRNLLDDMAPAPRSRWQTALGLFQLVAPAEPLDEAMIEEAVANIAGFYDPERGVLALVIRDDDADPLDNMLVLSHEFVHYLQDRELGLVALNRRWVDSTDSSAALTSLIEGEAVVLSFILVDDVQNRDPHLFDWARYETLLLELMLPGIEASASPLLAATGSLVYPVGTGYVAEAWLSGGQPAVSALYKSPPRSVVDLQQGFDSTADAATTLVEPLDCFPTTPPSDYSGVDHDQLGVLGAFSLLVGHGVSAHDAWTLSQAWRGDRIIVFTPTPGSDRPQDDVAVAWRLRLRSDADALAWLNELEGRLPGAALHRDGSEVLIGHATVPEVTDSWSNLIACGTQQELPIPSVTVGDMLTAFRGQRHCRHLR